MKNFTFNPFTTNKFATAKTYIAELNNNVESLVQYIELTNPNYVILNKNLGSLTEGKPFYTDEQLFNAGVIQLAINNGEAIILLRPNKLRLHRGIVQKYGANARAILLTDDELIEYLVPYRNLNDNEKELIKSLAEKFGININDENSSTINVFYYSDLATVFFMDSNNNQNALDTLVLENVSTLETAKLTLVDENGDEVVSRINPMYYIPQGRVIFSHIQPILPEAEDSDIYKDFNNYSIYPTTSPGNFYIPDLIPDTTTGFWEWKLSEQKILDDLVVLFNMFTPNLRFFSKNTMYIYSGYEKIKPSEIATENKFLSFIINSDNEIEPLMSSLKGTLWTGADVNRLITHYVNIPSESESFTEEEVILDDEINFGKDKLVNYSNPYYNIIVKHKTVPESFIYTKLW